MDLSETELGISEINEYLIELHMHKNEIESEQLTLFLKQQLREKMEEHIKQIKEMMTEVKLFLAELRQGLYNHLYRIVGLTLTQELNYPRRDTTTQKSIATLVNIHKF